MLTFRALMDASNRIACILKTEQAWTTMVAAQGDHKAMKEWVKRWSDQTKPSSQDAEDFQRAFKGGI